MVGGAGVVGRCGPLAFRPGRVGRPLVVLDVADRGHARAVPVEAHGLLTAFGARRAHQQVGADRLHAHAPAGREQDRVDLAAALGVDGEDRPAALRVGGHEHLRLPVAGEVQEHRRPYPGPPRPVDHPAVGERSRTGVGPQQRVHVHLGEPARTGLHAPQRLWGRLTCGRLGAGRPRALADPGGPDRLRTRLHGDGRRGIAVPEAVRTGTPREHEGRQYGEEGGARQERAAGHRIHGWLTVT
ncbi:hypothetical protein DEJ48_26780 [Streptomyces venezuelae]|uniref:Uncharacterized protein n=1 Tax=Streptomyces venezuelae TaxID=54571 RepID=A0A5P2C1H5_STRVZ|nr:hypothetical protein DEJ48_26780 [Streptomyces venezuelae]